MLRRLNSKRLTFFLLIAVLSSFLNAQERTPSTPRGIPSTYVGEETPDRLSVGESAQILSLQIFMILWITFLGGAVGSFLNVVAYRLPLGISLLYPPSRCPGCETPIELRDNLPVIGWVLLKGRCRNCRISIPLRYPLIEAAAALIFLLVSYLELLSGGATLPVRPPNHYTGFVWIIWFTKWDLISIYLYHICLLSYLLTTAILIYDGNPPPQKTLDPLHRCRNPGANPLAPDPSAPLVRLDPAITSGDTGRFSMVVRRSESALGRLHGVDTRKISGPVHRQPLGGSSSTIRHPPLSRNVRNLSRLAGGRFNRHSDSVPCRNLVRRSIRSLLP